MKRPVAVLPLMLLLGLVLTGCAPPPASTAGAGSAPPMPPPPPGTAPAAAQAPASAAPANERPLPLESKVGVFAGSLDDLSAPVSSPPTSAPAASPAPSGSFPASANTETVVAKAGVGLKGRSLDEYEGVIVTPAKTLFTVRERVVFEIQIPGALNLFNASEGRNPESHDEFMEKIVKFNNIKLPELPSGQKYVYDPARNELMVERPKLKSAP